MYLDVFIYFLISLLQSSLRTNPGQGQNNQLFGGSLVSVKSIEKVTSTQDSRFKIQEGLLTNAKVYIHVTIWIKVVTQTAMYSQYYIHDLQRNK